MWYDGRSNLAPMELTENGPWSLAEYWREKGSYAADCVLELRARVEALETALTPPDAICRAEFEAEFTSQYCNTWPDKEFEPPANCSQRLQRNGAPYPKSGCNACGRMSPKWRECDAVLDRLAATESSPAGGGLAEQVAAMESAAPPASSLVERLEAAGYGRTHARAAIREVAAAAHVVCPFDPVENPAEHEGWSDMICWLEQEANR